ncbi:hypothetical protein BOX37_14155 [Nocardia mangyaensis]|uniref:Uncharacterized protein n=1 Tax=Nocardia mangyaensis TaxID=2213200 RepID=A0A1J0VS90_9NOCA|nr:CoA transferase [Nocardia mangyaensis]APE34901.1 hypothetical protein BOX37_14155 [Nocardia mangyaensis]
MTRPALGLPPVFTALPMASVHAGVHGASAAVSALVGRDRDGCGDQIEVPLASCLSVAPGSALLDLDDQQHRYDVPPLARPVRMLLPTLRGVASRPDPRSQAELATAARALIPPLMDSYRCADDQLPYLFAMDHDRIPHTPLRTLEIAEAATRIGLTTQDPYRVATTDNLHDAAGLSFALRRTLCTLIAQRLAARPADVWEELLGNAGVPCAVQRTTDQWRAHPAVIPYRQVCFVG